MGDILLNRAADLLGGCRLAALATVDHGSPAVSLVPYALADKDLILLILVSRLAAHTTNMLVDGRVAMLITAPETTPNAHATPRLSLRGDATALDPATVSHATAKRRYSGQFPDMTGLFDLADFTLFAIRPVSLRMVAGFAQAATIDADALASLMFGHPPT